MISDWKQERRFKAFSLIILLSLDHSQLCSAGIVRTASWNMTIMVADILLALADCPNER